MLYNSSWERAVRNEREAAPQGLWSVQELIRAQSSSSLQPREAHRGAGCPPAVHRHHAEQISHAATEEPTVQQRLRTGGGTTHGYT